MLPTTQLVVNPSYQQSLGDSPFFVYHNKDAELPATRFANPRFTYAENLSFEQERQRRESYVMEMVKARLLEAADQNCHQVLKKSKERTLRVDDRVFVRRYQKKGESKLIPRWRGPYRIIAQKTPGVYKLKDLTTGNYQSNTLNILKIKV